MPLRGVANGRRSYLFFRADAGAERAAAIYLLIGTAQLYSVAPEAMFRQVLLPTSPIVPSTVLMSSCLGIAVMAQASCAMQA